MAIFDLDETLVHCVLNKLDEADVVLNVKMNNGKKVKVGINIRPLIKESLQEISKDYVCIMYTASEKCYADTVMDYIDPEYKLIKHRLYRSECVKVMNEDKSIYIKDLRIFKNVDLKDMIIIDNSVLSFAFHLDNGIPILPFYDNKRDNEFQFLVNYLKHLAKFTDIRIENKKLIQLDYFMKKAERLSEFSDSDNYEGNLKNQMQDSSANESDYENCEKKETKIIEEKVKKLGVSINTITSSGGLSYDSSILLTERSIKDEINQAWSELKFKFDKFEEI